MRLTNTINIYRQWIDDDAWLIDAGETFGTVDL